MATRKWYGVLPDSKQRKEELEKITAFGYQCKLFRDDEKAAYIDRGKHLIPWMGDSSLMIDRYDGRGSLFDLKPYDAEFCPKEDHLTQEDIETEKILDEERYLELHTDMVEQETYEEEEMKRLNEALQTNSYGAVAFNYSEGQGDSAATNGQTEVTETEDVVPPDEVEEEQFEPDPELQLPPNIIPPKTVKHNAIIEKTASFIAKQGSQMEIVIKTKQKDNPQFDFLNYENVLNRYYRHMIKQIKNGRYTPKPPAPRPSRDSHSEGDGYLHPSLRNTALEPEHTSESFLASVRSKLPAGQIANTAYAKLLNNMRKHTNLSRSNSPAPQPPHIRPTASSTSLSSLSQDTNQYYPSSGNSSPYNSLSQQPPVPGMEPVQLPQPDLVDPLPPGTEGEEEVVAAAAVHGPQLPQPPPPHGVVEGPQLPAPQLQPVPVSSAAGVVHGPHLPPAPPPPPVPAGYHHGPQPYVPPLHGPHGPPGPPQPHGPYGPHGPPPPPPQAYPTHSVAPPPYGTVAPHPPPPAPDVQPIIDKMANYVARNGLEFEVTVRNKNDPRFEFLQEWHAHHQYYLCKKEEIKKELERKKDEEKHQNRAVSFKVKTKEAEAATVGKGALLGSDEEEDNDGMKMDENGENSNSNQIQLVDYPTSKPQKAAQLVTSEDALRNKLAAAARGKLATATKTDHVMAERKRKAAMFAAMLKGGGASAAPPANAPPPAQPQPQPQPQPAPVQGPSLPPSHKSSASASPRSTPSRSSLKAAARRSRSRSPRRSKHRSRSRSYSPRRSKHRRSRTPPSGYVKSNRISPVRQVRSPVRTKRVKRSRSRGRRSRSPARRSSSRSRTSGAGKSHKASKKTKHRSRSRSNDKRKRSRSRSRKRSKKSRSRSRTRKSEKSSKASKSAASKVETVKDGKKDSDKALATNKAASEDSSSETDTPRRMVMERQTDSESETERLRQAALDSEAANLRKKALESSALKAQAAAAAVASAEDIEDGEVTDKSN